MKIRHATTADVPALNRLVNSAYRGEDSKKGWTTEADLLDGIRTTEEDIAAMIGEKKSVILLAEEDKELQGCVYLKQLDDALYLGMLTVTPGLQGKGIGAALMQAAEERAHALGLSKIKMTVITVRDELIAYYKRKGYTDTGERSPFQAGVQFGIPKKPLEFMIMEKTLA